MEQIKLEVGKVYRRRNFKISDGWSAVRTVKIERIEGYYARGSDLRLYHLSGKSMLKQERGLDLVKEVLP